jgi:hypothetical protein
LFSLDYCEKQIGNFQLLFVTLSDSADLLRFFIYTPLYKENNMAVALEFIFGVCLMCGNGKLEINVMCDSGYERCVER